MERDKTLKKISELYSDNLSEHGSSSKAVGWPNEKDQILRFEVLNKVISKKDKKISINDFGCGFGSHLIHLVNSGYRIDCYNGYDISKNMLVEAKKIIPKNYTTVNLINDSEITTLADYTFVSGTFNVRFEMDDKAWKNFIETKLIQIDKFSKKGFSFNLLSTYVDWKNSKLFYGDPKYWFDFCKNNFSRFVSLIHDYPLYEWTITVKKNK
tara:strand:+ start:743 stop:1375 length:633 start_codon:yes stop_codon:yes gene_type:complete